MTIYKDGKEQEKITLSDYNDKNKLHQLFNEKGFTKYSETELAARRKMKEEQAKTYAAQLNRPFQKGHTQNFVPAKFVPSKLRGGDRNKKAEMKDRLRKLKQARENFMLTPPVDKKR